jgi:hypothetical protein
MRRQQRARTQSWFDEESERMSPRPGGEADKFGNRYEGAWTVRQVLDVIAGRIDRMQVEPAGIAGEGAEFLIWRDGRVEAHQVKRQVGNAKNWTVLRLVSVDVIESARKHVSEGREFHFVSTIPTDLDEIADRAKRSADLAAFRTDMLTAELRPVFGDLVNRCEDEQDAFNLLQHVHLHATSEIDRPCVLQRRPY